MAALHRARRALAICLLATAGAAVAQTVTLSGRMGDKALLVIDGTPRTLAVGASAGSVRLVSVSAQQAVVEIGGRRATLVLGGAPVSLGGGAAGPEGTQIVLAADSGGHFVTQGSINGRPVRFIVDTGATYVSLSQQQADRIGLAYRQGRQGMAQTANGVVTAYVTSLDAVRVGDVQVHNVEAMVVPMPMEQVLLGNSFLTRFQMKRENDRLTLERRY